MPGFFLVVATICLGLSDSQCRPLELQTDQTTKRGCEVASIMLLAEWASSHDKWTVRRWNCVAPEKRQMGA